MLELLARTGPWAIREVEDKLTSILDQPFIEESIDTKKELIERLKDGLGVSLSNTLLIYFTAAYSHSSFFSKHNNTKSALNNLLEQEKLFGDRAKENWVKLGDCNTKYFHQNANRRQRRNWLHSLVDDGWTVKEMEDVVVSYFSTLFTSNGAANFKDNLCNITLSVTEEMNNDLGRPITDEECAVFHMHPTKAPEPDGPDVCNGIRAMVLSGQILRKLTQLRPVSLCNVLYKITAKVLTNRLKLILPHIVTSRPGPPPHLGLDSTGA
ncbi:hypothetical protein DVH24_016345 [Malus domestica]|uniref:Uncharacterized protein n=1 Tax=Malus domestica TaxID=3750 RepID=A0A498HXA9_MALDO|nr:hypothetical protein DVH24_016345 [Malus domestica]